MAPAYEASRAAKSKVERMTMMKRVSPAVWILKEHSLFQNARRNIYLECVSLIEAGHWEKEETCYAHIPKANHNPRLGLGTADTLLYRAQPWSLWEC